MDTLVSAREPRQRADRGSAAREPRPRGRFAPPERRAESFYRRGTGLAALFSGALVLAGVLVTPSDHVGTGGYLHVAAEPDDALRWAADLQHYGFLLLVPAAFGMAYLSRRRARRTSNLGLLLAVVGSGVLGLVAGHHGLALTGAVLGSVLLGIALCRSGFVRWPVPVLVAAGWLVLLPLADRFAGAVAGTSMLALATALVGLRILYASDAEWETGVPD